MKLIYYPDKEPGVRRSRQGRGFSYFTADGARIDDASERKRLNAIAVPPAYEDVWMSPLINGHLLATGRDEKGRKQYIYHPDWRQLRETRKFDNLANVGASLPKLRGWIERQLRGELGEKSTAIAAVLALLDRASLRPGDPSNTRKNNSFGATTIGERHVDFDGETVRLDYRAKGGKRVKKQLHGKRLARVLEGSRDLPGAALVSWLDDAGVGRIVRSDDVNAALSDICQAKVTAKSLRTWNGSHAAFMVACSAEKLTISAMANAASERLHNTPTIARNSYIHPQVIALAELKRDQRAEIVGALSLEPAAGFRSGERALVRFLENL